MYFNCIVFNVILGAPGVLLPRMEIQYVHTPNLPHPNPKFKTDPNPKLYP